MRLQPLTPIEARVLGTLMEKARTVPDTYPLTLNSLVAGCNQKTSREPVMSVTEAQVREALDSLRHRSLVFESSGGRVARWEHNFQRAVGVPEQSAVLLGLLMLRGPQTAGELRINSERWYRFADISSVEAFLEELRERAEEKADRWSCCCHARRACASSAGRTCCADPWTRAKRPRAPGPASCRATRSKHASRHWRAKWPRCVLRCKTSARSSVCRNLDNLRDAAASIIVRIREMLDGPRLYP